MNTQIASAATTEGRQLVNFTLGELKLSPINPRQSVSDTEIDALAGSIRSVGLLQNLAGIQTKDAIEIVAGGRRLRALKLIAEQDGRENMTVPVILAENETEAQAWANSENVARSSLHPAEEIRAYRKMAETGATLETIAKAFAVTLRHVKGRMRLADLPAAILDALAADEITLDAAAAYTVSADPSRQLEVFERMKGFWNGQEPKQIKRNLMAESGGSDSKLVRFVGREAYEDAGGAISEDLFGEEIWYLDKELLTRLASEKLGETASCLKTEGWSCCRHGDNRHPSGLDTSGGFFQAAENGASGCGHGGSQGAAVTEAFQKLKKKDKAAFLHRLFNEEAACKDLDAAARARIAAWL